MRAPLTGGPARAIACGDAISALPRYVPAKYPAGNVRPAGSPSALGSGLRRLRFAPSLVIHHRNLPAILPRYSAFDCTVPAKPEPPVGLGAGTAADDAQGFSLVGLAPGLDATGMDIGFIGFPGGVLSRVQENRWRYNDMGRQPSLMGAPKISGADPAGDFRSSLISPKRALGLSRLLDMA